MRIPLLLMPETQAKRFSHHFLGVASRIGPAFAFIQRDIFKLDNDVSVTEYLALFILNSLMYFAFTSVLAFAVLYRLRNPDAPLFALACGLLCGAVVFMLGLVYPRWLARKKVMQIDRNLLFAARHLRIQTTAGVPLFEAFVSVSHGYGEVSEEFARVVKNIQAGVNMADALEDTAVRNPSYYYNRILWQMSNAVKAGTDVAPVLGDIVDFLAEEQRVEMRNYGAQLNTLAIMYLMVCIIAPTILLIFIMVISSFVDLPITETVFWLILGALVFVQYMFVGLIQNRRPVVAI